MIFAAQHSTGTSTLIYKWDIKKKTKQKTKNKRHPIHVPHEVYIIIAYS